MKHEAPIARASSPCRCGGAVGREDSPSMAKKKAPMPGKKPSPGKKGC